MLILYFQFLPLSDSASFGSEQYEWSNNFCSLVDVEMKVLMYTCNVLSFTRLLFISLTKEESC